MKRGLRFMALLIAGSVLLLLLRAPEPKYQGRTISAWHTAYAARQAPEWPKALQHFGTNALPYAVRNLAWNDSTWRSNYVQLHTKLPARLQSFLPKPKPLLREVDGANVFFYLGSNAIPHAITLLKHDNPTVRRASAWGIGSIRRQSPAANQAIPALIEALSDPDFQVRFNTVLSLKEMGADASNAVPALIKVVANTGVGPQTNDFFSLRAAAAVALGKMGPPAASALPALKGALQESNSYLRGQSAVAIWRIAAEVDLVLPVLLREMPNESEHSKWDWIVALGEMGPRAKAAVSQLQKELQEDQETWVLNYVTNALKSIDPAAAIEAGMR